MTLFVSQWATLLHGSEQTRAATKWPPQQQQQEQQSLAINDMCGSKGRPHSSSGSRMMATTTCNTHTQAALQDAACLLPVLAMAIVVINGRHNKWVKCPDWVSVSAVCVCVCVWSVASAKVVDRAENAVRGAGERARAVYVLILSCVACKTNYR